MLVGISGFKRSGKDTVGLYLAKAHDFHRHSFAKTLKDSAKIVFRLSEDQVNGHLKEKPDKRFPLRGLDPRDGTRMTAMRHGHPVGQGPSEADELKWWQAKDGKYFPRYLTPRLIMTTTGTDARKLYDSVYMDACLARVDMKVRNCITDVRYRLEVQTIQDHGGVVVRLLRGEQKDDHSSESELADMDPQEFDYVIDNRGPLEELWPQIDRVAKDLIKKDHATPLPYI